MTPVFSGACFKDVGNLPARKRTLAPKPKAGSFISPSTTHARPAAPRARASLASPQFAKARGFLRGGRAPHVLLGKHSIAPAHLLFPEGIPCLLGELPFSRAAVHFFSLTS